MSRKNRNRKWRVRKNAVITPWAPASYGTPNLGHVVLLGDSIFDNGSYTSNQPDVAQRLYGQLGEEWEVTLLARDGATTSTLPYQLDHLPGDATQLVVSIGGNDANCEWSILRDKELRTMRDSLDDLAFMALLFGMHYKEAMDAVLATGLPVTVCTIYGCDFGDDFKYPARAALALFNDVIIQYAFANDLPILDLRLVCTSPEDYEMEIEPSAIGGAKIARAIAGTLPSFISA